MELKGLILVPAQFRDNRIKFDTSSFFVEMTDGSHMELDVISVNCSSLSKMPGVLSDYFNEVIKRPPTETNIITATYLGMMDMLLRDYPHGFPIRQDILDIIHQDPDFLHIQRNTGYYFQFKIKDWIGVNQAVKKTMYGY